MEARSVDEIPSGRAWQYEPKWNGFRCLAFRNRSNIFLQSKAGQPLARYFPDVVRALRELKTRVEGSRRAICVLSSRDPSTSLEVTVGATATSLAR